MQETPFFSVAHGGDVIDVLNSLQVGGQALTVRPPAVRSGAADRTDARLSGR